MSATFSVVILTAPPAGMTADTTGAFVKVDGRECLLRSVELFLNRDPVKQVLLAVDPARMEDAKARYGAHLSFSGVKLIAGGPKWTDQLAAVAPAIDAAVSHVVVHDAARPAVPYSDIDALFESADSGKEIAALTTPVRATLLETDEGGNPVAAHSPERFVQLLTPMSIARGKFVELAGKKQEPHASTIHPVKGSPLNIRVGSNGDATLTKAHLNMLPKPKKNPLSNPFEEAQW